METIEYVDPINPLGYRQASKEHDTPEYPSHDLEKTFGWIFWRTSMLTIANIDFPTIKVVREQLLKSLIDPNGAERTVICRTFGFTASGKRLIDRNLLQLHFYIREDGKVGIQQFFSHYIVSDIVVEKWVKVAIELNRSLKPLPDLKPKKRTSPFGPADIVFPPERPLGAAIEQKIRSHKNRLNPLESQPIPIVVTRRIMPHQSEKLKAALSRLVDCRSLYNIQMVLETISSYQLEDEDFVIFIEKLHERVRSFRKEVKT